MLAIVEMASQVDTFRHSSETCNYSPSLALSLFLQIVKIQLGDRN
ncbi:hypothetical protein [Nostoc sp. CENA543]|nr:hypothetical protein [Nostoc sp. CENA543]